MPIQFNLSGTLRLLLAFAAVVVTFGLFAPSCSATNVTWRVKITFKASDPDNPTYSVQKGTTGTCAYLQPQPLQGYAFHICAGDTVVWEVVVPGHTGYKLRIFFPRMAFTGPGGGLKKSFDGDETHLAKGTVGVPADDLDEYSYSVGVIDKESGNIYVHDPKIIIGTGTMLTGEELVNSLRDISRSGKELNATEGNKPKVNEDLKKLDEVIDKLREDLHVH